MPPPRQLPLHEDNEACWRQRFHMDIFAIIARRRCHMKSRRFARRGAILSSNALPHLACDIDLKAEAAAARHELHAVEVLPRNRPII